MSAAAWASVVVFLGMLVAVAYFKRRRSGRGHAVGLEPVTMIAVGLLNIIAVVDTWPAASGDWVKALTGLSGVLALSYGLYLGARRWRRRSDE